MSRRTVRALWMRSLAATLVLLSLACDGRAPDASWLGEPDRLAPGVEFYRSNEATLVEHVGPIAIHLLRIDPAAARVASVLGNDRVLDAEAVLDIARRHNAVAAINGGFFNRANGEPLGLLKVDGDLVSDTPTARGVVIVLSPPGGPTELIFDRLSARASISFAAGEGDAEHVVPLGGVDTTRERGKLMLYTHRYSVDTDTAPTGTEWVLDGDPLRVTRVRPGSGSTPIPRRGVVLSYGGLDLPPALAALSVGTEVRVKTTWRSSFDVPAETLEAARHIINGAGLLRRSGVRLTNWDEESLSPTGFVDARHPRTLIGVDRAGAIWLAAVDGRQPDYSIGMTFADLQRLCDRLHLTDALNLDGGGSTTMVVRGQVANRPSDLIGARPVSDAVIVTSR